MKIQFRQLASLFALIAALMSLSGCGTYIVAKTVTDVGSLAVGGAVGAVKLTGKAAGAVVGIGRSDDEDYE